MALIEIARIVVATWLVQACQARWRIESDQALLSTKPLDLDYDGLGAAPIRTPLLIWHGLGDSYNSEGIEFVGQLLNETVGPTITYNIRLTDDGASDRQATFFGDVNEQVEKVCSSLRNHPVLGKTEAVHAIGFSQGGQFLQAYIERCNVPPVRDLITFGSQHNGIQEFNNCGTNGTWSPGLCHFWNRLLKTQTWTSYVQHKLVPAQYFRNPADLEAYFEHSNFLADINNERQTKNDTYRRHLSQLRRFVMYIFADDTTVVPRQSGHFDEVLTKDDGTELVVKLRDRKLYREDWLGLKILDEKGALDFRETDGAHMAITTEVLQEAFRIMYD